jgi:hypothetical protein
MKKGNRKEGKILKEIENRGKMRVKLNFKG